MDEPSIFEPDGPVFWDATMLSAYSTCPRFFQYRILERWQRSDDNVHLWFGKHYASALEHFHREVALGASRQAALTDTILRLLAATQDTDGYGSPTKNRFTLMRAVVWYVQNWATEQYTTLIMDDGKPAVEVHFNLEIKDGFHLCGHLDRVVRDPAGNIFIQDQKTTGSTITPEIGKKYKPLDQFAAYAYAGQVLFNSPIAGVILDVAQIAVGFSRYRREPIFYTEEELDEWMEEKLELMHHAREAYHSSRFPRNLSSCHNMGGCSFREVCSQNPRARPDYLNKWYLRGEQWNPAIPRT